jgi:hypothetical protein|nr:MAG TPA: tail protein [Bacteriophage sp.]
MRITAFSDDKRILDTSLEQLKLINPKISQEDNKVGSFTFTIYPDHPYYNFIDKMKSIITVYEEGISEPLFRGRVYDEKTGFYNEKQVSCEGELAFLLDSIQRPYTFPDKEKGQSGTPAELFIQYINNHNSQVDETRQFKIGNITVTDPNNYIVRSNSDYVSTWDELNAKLIDHLGGHLWVRHESDGVYIDYLADFDVLSNQMIEFGKNLLDLQKNIKVDGFATALIPLGAKLKDEEGNETGERLTIKSVNNNVDYVYNAEAVAQYGYIFTTNTWDDVTLASNLKTKGQTYIDNVAQFAASIEVSAADLNGATIDGEVASVNSFRIGRYVKVNTKPHSIENQKFIISKLTRELLKPENTKLTLGTTYKTLTEKQLSQAEQLNQYVQTVSEQVKKSGKGIKEIAEYYLVTASSSGVTHDTSGWITDIPTMTTTNKYLWNYEKITYTDNSVDKQTPKVIGVYGDSGKNGSKGENGKDGVDGNGIKSIVNYYLATASSSGVTTTTSGWSTTVQNVTSSKKYLWNYEVVTYTKGNPTTTTPCIIGAYGDTGAKGDTGKGISSITEQYYLSTSKDATTGGNWIESAPKWENGKYIWTRSKIMYTDNTTVYTTAVCDSSWEAVNNLQIGGRNLFQGTKEFVIQNVTGIDGVGSSIATEKYKGLTVRVKSGPWNFYRPTLILEAGRYVFSSYVKGTSKYKGDIRVQNVTESTTLNAKSFDIKSEWDRQSLTFELTKKANVKFSLESTGSGEIYECGWKLELGDKATDWTPAPEDVNSAIGLNVSAVDIYYYLSTSATGLAGGSWNTKAPTWVNGKYIWQKTVTTLANGIKTETTPVCITGANNTAIQSNTEPVDKTLMWLDTSTEPPILKRWNGTAWVVVNDITNTINLLEQRFTADISTSEKNIKQTLTESYYTKDATDSLVSSVSSSWEHTAKGFEMQFDNISKNLDDVSNNADTRFQEISKYIRFVDGNIVLGEAGSELILKIANDRISFLQNNTEVAYFSNRKLYVTDGEYTNSLQLGKFAFIPRSNGNLSFKKIVD